MSLNHTTSLTEHTARTFSEIEHEYSTQSFVSSADRTTAVEDDIQLKPYPPSYTTEVIEKNNNDNESIMSKKKRRWLVFRRVAYIVIMNAAIPIALYYILKEHLPAVWALVLSSTPTIISVIVQAIFMKRIDSIGVAVIFGKYHHIRHHEVMKCKLIVICRFYIVSCSRSVKWRSKNAFTERVFCVSVCLLFTCIRLTCPLYKQHGRRRCGLCHHIVTYPLQIICFKTSVVLLGE